MGRVVLGSRPPSIGTDRRRDPGVYYDSVQRSLVTSVPVSDLSHHYEDSPKVSFVWPIRFPDDRCFGRLLLFMIVIVTTNNEGQSTLDSGNRVQVIGTKCLRLCPNLVNSLN